MGWGCTFGSGVATENSLEAEKRGSPRWVSLTAKTSSRRHFCDRWVLLREPTLDTETKPARISDARIESHSCGKGESKMRGRANRRLMVKRMRPAAGVPGPATARAGGKREQRARESRAPRFGRGATYLASPRALGAPNSPDRVNGTAATAAGSDPATARSGGKREQRARESRAPRFGQAGGLYWGPLAGQPLLEWRAEPIPTRRDSQIPV